MSIYIYVPVGRQTNRHVDQNIHTIARTFTYLEASLPREVDSARLEVNLVSMDVRHLADDTLCSELLIQFGIHGEDLPPHPLNGLL